MNVLTRISRICPRLGTVAIAGFSLSSAEAQESRPMLIPHPTWDCYLPDGIPDPAAGDLIIELEIPLDRTETVGRTPFGERSVAVGLPI